jgi:hypothetical protein
MVENQLSDDDSTLVQHDVMQTILVQNNFSLHRFISLTIGIISTTVRTLKSPTYHTSQWSISYTKVTHLEIVNTPYNKRKSVYCCNVTSKTICWSFYMVLSTYIGIKATHKNERARDIAQKF